MHTHMEVDATLSHCGKLFLLGPGHTHPFHPDVYITVYFFGGEVIFVDDFLGDDIYGYSVEILLVHWIFEVEVIDVQYKIFIVVG